jgi:hypothetical protein
MGWNACHDLEATFSEWSNYFRAEIIPMGFIMFFIYIYNIYTYIQYHELRLYQWVLYIHIHMNDYDQLYIYMNSNVSRFRPEKQWWYRVIPRDNDWDDGRMIGQWR